jgi:chaperonin GroES
MSTNGSTPDIYPLGARVLIQPLEGESRTNSGIYVPETAKEKPQTGMVIAIGEDEDIKVQVNDRVLFPKYSGTEIKFNGIEYLLMESSDILARLAEPVA